MANININYKRMINGNDKNTLGVRIRFSRKWVNNNNHF
jgi:hypothetical protein